MAKKDDLTNKKKTQVKINDYIKGKSSEKSKNSNKESKINYDSLATGRKAARVGLDSEQGIIDAINTNPEFRELIRNCLQNLGLPYKGKITSIDVPKQLKKDILINIDKESIGVSIKSRKTKSFHQTDRRRLEKWKKFLNMPDDIFNIIKKAILRKAERGRAVNFILNKDHNTIIEFFSQNYRTIIREIFIRNEDDLLILLINDIKNEKIYLYKMDEVLEFLIENVSNHIGFTDNGIIELGSFLTIQRKGGNGVKINKVIPKTEWRHPGNNLQFKFYPIEFADHIKKEKPIRFSEFDYLLQIFQ